MRKNFYILPYFLLSLFLFGVVFAEDVPMVDNTEIVDSGTVQGDTGSSSIETSAIVGLIETPSESGRSITGTISTGSMEDPSMSGILSVQSQLEISDTILYTSPTIHSIPGFGNWNDPGSWSEGRIPTTDDIVEINGTMTLTNNASIGGITINIGAKLSGTISSLSVDGDIKNNGKISVSGLSVYGDIENYGTWSASNTVINGSGTNIDASNPIDGNLTINSEVTIIKTFTLNGILTFNQIYGVSQNLNINPGQGLNINGGMNGIGNITGAGTFINLVGGMTNLVVTGSLTDLNILGSSRVYANTSLLSFKNITLFSGSTLYTDFSLLNFSINSEKIFINSGASIGWFPGIVIQSSIINHGIINGNITIDGDIWNQGKWNATTHAYWPASSGATYYTVRFDPGSSSGFTTAGRVYNITDKLNGIYYWQVTPNNGIPYEKKCINIIGCNVTVTPAHEIPTPAIPIPIIPRDISYLIYPKESTPAIILNVHQNISTTVQDKDANDPVDLATGNFTYSNTLMRLAGDGIDYVLDVSYESQIEYNGTLGYNWDHSYNKRLIVNTGGSITYIDGKLGKYTFIQSGSTYLPFTGLGMNLSKTASGKFQMEFKNGDKYFYNSDLLISEIRNENNKSLFFVYSSGKLSTVTDTLGRDIAYLYTASGLLSQITESGGRQVNLTYFQSGSLTGNEGDLQNIEIRNGTDQKNIGFTYSQNTGSKLAHNILTMTDSKGAIYVTNTYDTNDRVLIQKYGEHTGSYEYTTKDIHQDDTILSIGSGAIIGNYVTKNRVRDRSGNITDYTFDRMGNILERTSGDITTKYTYNSLGQLINIILPNGNGTKYSYDTLGNKIEIRKKTDMSLADNDTIDIITHMSYTGAINTIESIIDPRGAVTTFESDTQGNITKIIKHATTDTPKRVESFIYDTAGHLIEKTDARGTTTAYEYDPSGKIKKVIKGKGTPDETTTSYTYDTYGNPLTETDGRGNTKTLSYDTFDRITRSTTAEGIINQSVYDANNNQIQTITNIGESTILTTNTVYNLLDKPTTLTADIDATRRASISYTYDADDRLLTTTYPNNQKEKRTYDALGRLIEKSLIGSTTRLTNYTYDNNGNVLTENIDGKTSTFMYDGFDRLISSTDALGTKTTLSYDKNGNIVEAIIYSHPEFFSSSSSILKRITTEYDRDNRSIKITEYGNTTNQVTTKTYDEGGNVLNETSPNNTTTINTYDTLGRIQSTTLTNGVRTENTYDKNSNITKQRIISPDKIIVTMASYDRDNRKISSTDASGNQTIYEYNTLRQVTKIIDPKSIPTTYDYDFRGNVTRETRGEKTTSKSYDLMGNLVSLTDANNNTTRYTYSGNNELISETLPDGKSSIYTYDARGNIETKTDPNGTRVHYTYDTLDRITQKDITLGAGVLGVTWEAYVYDDLGQLISSTDSSGKTITFTYDLFGNLTSETNGNKTISYTYDLLGNKLSTTTPSGKVITNVYDQMNRITSIKRDNVNVATYTYNSLNLQKESLGNGTVTNYSYDGGNRLNLLSHPELGSGSRSESLTYDKDSNIISAGNNAYTYDVLGQVIQAMYTDKRYGNIQGNAYEYDLMGNRKNEQNIRIITKTTKTGAIITTEKKTLWNYSSNTLNQYTDVLAQSGSVAGSGSIAVISTGSTSDVEISSSGTTDTGTLFGRILYDNNGNIIGNILNLKREYEYSYDYNNRLISVNRTNSINQKEVLISYTYDTLGRRTSKRVANQLTEYIYSGNDIIEETLSTVNPTTQAKTKKEMREYIYCSQGMDDIITVTITPYARINKVDTPGTINSYYYEKDHLGSVIRITSSTGTIVDEYSYTLFGKAYKKNSLGVYRLVSDSNKSAIGNTRLFTGREYDREVGLYYLRARYYDAGLGRFISRDPIGMSDDVNLYGYVGNSPVGYVDRMGREKILLEEIKNGNQFTVSLVGRNLQKFPTVAGTHTFILIDSKNNKGNIRTYTIGGQQIGNIFTGKLTGVFNEPDDIILWKGLTSGGSFKSINKISTPAGMTSAQFVQNIYDEYKDYNINHQVRFNLGSKMPIIGGGNCSNLATTILFGASNNDQGIIEELSSFDNAGFDWGIGEILY